MRQDMHFIFLNNKGWNAKYLAICKFSIEISSVTLYNELKIAIFDINKWSTFERNVPRNFVHLLYATLYSYCYWNNWITETEIREWYPLKKLNHCSYFLIAYEIFEFLELIQLTSAFLVCEICLYRNTIVVSKVFYDQFLTGSRWKRAPR